MEDGIILPAVQKAFDDLLARSSYLTPDNKNRLIAAFWFAHRAHRTQDRASGDPYILHPIAVSASLADLHIDVHGLMAALLHDTVEDNAGIAQKDIEQNFGNVVAFLVNSVTKLEQYDKRAAFDYKKDLTVREKQAANLQYLMLNSEKDMRALVIKIADRLHNMQTLDHLKEEKQKRIAEETLRVYAPLASLIGMRIWKNELEGRAFQILHPRVYGRIVKQTRDLIRGVNESEIARKCDEFRRILDAAGVPVTKVYGRIKTPYAVWRKSQSKELRVPKLLDIIAFRVIVTSNRHCYRALEAIHRAFPHVHNTLDDYISHPKSNGYRSIHTVVTLPDKNNKNSSPKVEVQIRSKAMHRFAETGIAAHWRYKSSTSLSPEASSLLEKIQQDMEKNKMNEIIMGDVNLDSLSNEIVVYTPQGHLARLPNDATVLDFAFHIHTEIGEGFKEAKVNGHNVAMGHRLKHGDEVEIFHDINNHPEEFWKRHAKTHRAQSHIQQFLRLQAVKYFEKLIVGIAKQHGVAMLKNIDHAVMEETLKHFKAQDLPAFENKVNEGQIQPEEVLLVVQPDLEITIPEEPTLNKNAVIITNHVDKVQRCHFCTPLPGDELYGVSVLDKGTIAHRKGCSLLNTQNMHCFITDIHIEQPGASNSQEYPIFFDCKMTNRAGILGMIATAIGERGANISDITFMETFDDRVMVRFTLLVQHETQIAGIEKTVRARASDLIEVSRPFLEPKILPLPDDNED